MACPTAGNELNIGRTTSRRRPRSESATEGETQPSPGHGLAVGAPRQRPGSAHGSSSASPTQRPSPSPTLDPVPGGSDHEQQTAAETRLPLGAPSPEGLTPDGTLASSPSVVHDDDLEDGVPPHAHSTLAARCLPLPSHRSLRPLHRWSTTQLSNDPGLRRCSSAPPPDFDLHEHCLPPTRRGRSSPTPPPGQIGTSARLRHLKLLRAIIVSKLMPELSHVPTARGPPCGPPHFCPLPHRTWAPPYTLTSQLVTSTQLNPRSSCWCFGSHAHGTPQRPRRLHCGPFRYSHSGQQDGSPHG